MDAAVARCTCIVNCCCYSCSHVCISLKGVVEEELINLLAIHILLVFPLLVVVELQLIIEETAWRGGGPGSGVELDLVSTLHFAVAVSMAQSVTTATHKQFHCEPQ